MQEIEVVVAHSERATLRVGDVFLKIDADQARIDREVEVMARAPIPTPEVVWRKPPVLALAAVPGAALGLLGEPSPASAAAWVAAGAAVRTLHDADLPPWPSSQSQQQPARRDVDTVGFPPLLDAECEWLIANGVVSAEVVRRNRLIAEAALRPWAPVFIHGDLQIVHVFVDGDEVSGVVDWSEGGQGDAMYDLATLTLAHEEHLDDVIAGYGSDVDVDVIRAYWSLRSLMSTRWLAEHGYGEPATFPEVGVLTSLAGMREPGGVRRPGDGGSGFRSVSLVTSESPSTGVVMTVTQPSGEIPRTFGAGPSDPVCLADQPGTWVEIDIDAPVEEVWSLVTDIELPARFSDEFQGATWLDAGRAQGARFVGRNAHPAIGEWEVECFVEAWEEDHSFAWANGEEANPGARWRFDLEPNGRGTRLRFSMSMGPGPSGISMAIEAMPDKEPRILHRRVGEHHANMVLTVQGIRDLAEGRA